MFYWAWLGHAAQYKILAVQNTADETTTVAHNLSFRKNPLEIVCMRVAAKSIVKPFPLMFAALRCGAVRWVAGTCGFRHTQRTKKNI